jgi:hypothetical protein
MKVATIVGAVSFGAALAAACGGVATIGSDVGTRDGGQSGPETGSSIEPGDDATSAPDASMTGVPMLGFNVTCQSAQSCPRSQICCASLSLGGGAGAGGVNVACANTCGLLGFQVCATSAECATPGDVCTTSPLELGSICTAQRGDAGIRAAVDGGIARDAGTLDGQAPVEAGAPEDAMAPLDAALTSDAGAFVDAQVPVDAAAADAAALIDAGAATDDGPSDDAD